MTDAVRFELSTYDHPDAVKLIDALQQVFLVRYGQFDDTPVDSTEFSTPHGLFFVGYLGDQPVACGGWRRVDHDWLGDAAGMTVELKRMYVDPQQRGRGLARRLLGTLEVSAAEAGARRMILESGTEQPEAVALYRSHGYELIENFGEHADDPRNLCFGKELRCSDRSFAYGECRA